MIKLLIADDHLIIRQGLRLILETENDFEIVGEASDGAEALRLCASLNPDVVLMDLRMPGMDVLLLSKNYRSPARDAVVILRHSMKSIDAARLQAGTRLLLKDTERALPF